MTITPLIFGTIQAVWLCLLKASMQRFIIAEPKRSGPLHGSRLIRPNPKILIIMKSKNILGTLSAEEATSPDGCLPSPAKDTSLFSLSFLSN